MTAIVCKSAQKHASAIAQELASSLGDMKPSFLLLFCSSKLDFSGICRELGQRFPGTPAMGCTTAGELAGTHALSETAVLLATDAATIERAEVVSVSDARSPQALESALAELSQRLGQPLSALDPTHHLGLILQDGLSLSEERIMEALSSSTNVPFVGGSAGDDLAFHQTNCMSNFDSQAGSCSIALLVPARPFSILKTQSLTASGTVLTATDVDEATRTVRTFDGRPALVAYAKALETSAEEAVRLFIERPLGLVVGPEEVYTRSPQQVTKEGIVFYCQVKEGMKLHLLDPIDIVDKTREDLTCALAGMTSCSAIINFNCIQRTLLLRQQGREAEFASLFDQAPTIGFSTYGESYIGHINQTATMVLLG